jgi:hypothetical protein
MSASSSLGYVASLSSPVASSLGSAASLFCPVASSFGSVASMSSPAASSSASASRPASVIDDTESYQEITLDGQDNLGKPSQIKIVQDKGTIYILNGETNEVKATFLAKEMSFKEVLDIFLRESGMKISFVVPEVETSVSKLDQTVRITEAVGCVTLITGRNDSTYGHAQLVFEAIRKRHHAVWLTDIYLLDSEALSLHGRANIRVLDMTGRELIVTSQTDTWPLATRKIQEKVEKLKKQAAAHEKVLFFRTGNCTRGVPSHGNNCFTWAQGILEGVGIELYRDVYNYRRSSGNSRLWAKVYFAPSEVIQCNSIYSKGRVVVQIALNNYCTSIIPKADVTRRIHEAIMSTTNTPLVTFWRTDEVVYHATAQSDQTNTFSCCESVKIPVYVHVLNTSSVTKVLIDVTREVERQLNLHTVGCLNVERSAFDCESIPRDLGDEREAASQALQFWNDNETLGKIWSFFGSFFDSSSS